MQNLRSVPEARLCNTCKRLFNCGQASFYTTTYQIWYGERGYSYTRTREDLERSAKFGCMFCKELVDSDGQYSGDGSEDEFESSGSDNDDGEEDDEEDQYHFAYEKSGQRPNWFPPLGEELQFRIKFDRAKHSVNIFSDAIRWEGVDSVSWTLATTSGDPAQVLVDKTVEIHDFGSPASLSAAHRWLDECVAHHHHQSCPAYAPMDLPARLIKLPDGEAAGFNPRLCYTQGQKGDYCALSYCWGGPQPFVTTTDRYDAYLEEIPISALPATIRDAFLVARGLGLRYIWIDALCIIQDDPEDLQRQMSKMLQIYRQAKFTISAATAMSSVQGFLGVRNNLLSLPVRTDYDDIGSVLIPKSPDVLLSITKLRQPINQRAWTLQESFLSPRLLIFTDRNMVWRCETGFRPRPVRTIHQDEIIDHEWEGVIHDWGYSFGSINQKQRSFAAPKWEEWQSMVEKYSRRKMSVETDKLPGVSALAQAFLPNGQDQYIAGLWRPHLIYDLDWRLLSSRILCKPSNSGSPSWSWAGVDGAISYFACHAKDRYAYTTAEVVDCSVALVSDANPFGAVTGGQLIIKGYFKELQLTKAHLLLNGNGEPVPGTYRSDCGENDWEGQLQVWCLTLGNSPHSADHTSGKSISIILAKSQDRLDCYRRLGHFWGYGSSPFWWEQCDKVTVTII